MAIQENLNFFGKIKYVITSPKEFFEYVSRENSLKIVIKYYLLLNLILFPFGCIMAIFFNLDQKLTGIISYTSGQVITFFTFLLIILFYHLFVSLFGGKQGLLRTYQSYLYGATPGLLASWIPLVNFLAGFYSIYLTIIGLITLHKMEVRKAAAAYIISMLLSLIVISIAVLVISYISFGGIIIRPLT